MVSFSSAQSKYPQIQRIQEVRFDLYALFYVVLFGNVKKVFCVGCMSLLYIVPPSIMAMSWADNFPNNWFILGDINNSPACLYLTSTYKHHSFSIFFFIFIFMCQRCCCCCSCLLFPDWHRTVTKLGHNVHTHHTTWNIE